MSHGAPAEVVQTTIIGAERWYCLSPDIGLSRPLAGAATPEGDQ